MKHAMTYVIIYEGIHTHICYKNDNFKHISLIYEKYTFKYEIYNDIYLTYMSIYNDISAHTCLNYNN